MLLILQQLVNRPLSRRLRVLQSFVHPFLQPNSVCSGVGQIIPVPIPIIQIDINLISKSNPLILSPILHWILWSRVNLELGVELSIKFLAVGSLPKTIFLYHGSVLVTSLAKSAALLVSSPLPYLIWSEIGKQIVTLSTNVIWTVFLFLIDEYRSLVLSRCILLL